MTLRLRGSRPSDRDAIAAVHEAAFGRDDEARLVTALFEEEADAVSIVAEIDGSVVGHVLLSRLEGPDGALALAPLSVLPTRQRSGIGRALVEASIGTARAGGWASIFVLGDAGYYGRFGFDADRASGADVPWAGPHFMALELTDGALPRPIGRLVYPAAFSRL